MPEKTKILLVAPHWVGDVVMSHSLVQTLHRIHQNAQIDILLPANMIDLARRMPLINNIISLNIGHGEFKFKQHYILGKKLQNNNYDYAYIIPKKLKSALIPFFAKIPKRIGLTGESRYGLVNIRRDHNQKFLTKYVENLNALAYELGTTMPPDCPRPVLISAPEKQISVCEKLGLNPKFKPIICLMPGAEYGPAKQWPAEHFADLAVKFAEKNHQIWVLGSPKEQMLGAKIARNNPNVYNLCGKTSLVDAVDLLAQAKIAIGNDSGLLHIAAAVGTRVVGLYGATSPEYAPPLTEKSTILYQNLPCSPCKQRECPLGHQDCLRGIGVTQTWFEITKRDT